MSVHPIRISAGVIALLATVGAAVAASRGDRIPTPAVDAPRAPVRTSAAARAAVARYRRDLDALIVGADALARAADRGDTAAARTALRNARRAYKRLEYLAEQFTPLTAAGINGPAVDRPDDESPKVIVRPTGLQVAEAALYPTPAPDWPAAVRRQATLLPVFVRRLREFADVTPLTDAQLFDAVRLEIARVSTLGIAGADAPLARGSIDEARAALDAAGHAVQGYAPGTPAAAAFASALEGTVHALAAAPDFDAFDRYTFLTAHANPLGHALGALQDAAGVPRLPDRRVWSARANTVFDAGAFDPATLAAPDAPPGSPRLVALGRTLFHDARLSGRGDRSCATCHDPARAFQDGLVRARAVAGASTTPLRNTPTLLNAALQRAAFADARVAFLEDQVTAVIESPSEMSGRMDSAVARLRRDADARAAFAQAFAGAEERAVSARAVRYALAAYVRSLQRLDAPFDRAMRGDARAMPPAARRGFNLFMGKGGCGTCHFAPLFNGTVPPHYADGELEVVGVPATRGWRGVRLDTDSGAARVDGAPLHAHAFKTPTVRNAYVTAPYMHNGVYRTLDEVIEFYVRGGGAGLGTAVPNQTLSSARLRLDAAERRALVAFLRSLTDTTAGASRR